MRGADRRRHAGDTDDTDDAGAEAGAGRRGGDAPPAEQGAAELFGEAVGTVTSSPARRLLLRWLVLPAILRARRLPTGAPAPRVLRPPARARADVNHEDAVSAQTALVRRFHAAAARFEAAVHDAERGAQRRRIAHPYFGALSPRTAWRLLTIHTRHHARHLSNPAPGSPASS